AHSALGLVELRRADAEVGHQAVDALDAQAIELLAQAREGRVHEGHAVGDRPEELARGADGGGVPVEGDDPRPRLELEEGDDVTAAPEGDIDVGASGARTDGP